MNRRRSKKGQALIEYAFILVLVAAVALAVVALAGSQLASTYNDISFEFTHLTDSNTYAPNGAAVSPGASPPAGQCPSGQTLVLRGHKWKCK